MVFSSPVFLFAFLPLVLAVCFILPHLFKNFFLFLASFIFYAWGEVDYFYLMILSIIINYFLALAIDVSSGSLRKVYFILAIILNLLPLLFFKYADFILASTGFDFTISLALPLGISFFTFHALSYIIDVYRFKSAPQKNFINLGLYITNFPQLVAGPIVRYPEIESQLTDRKVTTEGFVEGIKRFIIGLSKKVLVANILATIADPVFGINVSELTTATAWLGIICYSLQIYFDFSGYSDMAIGLGKMFGFTFPENFNYPYISRSITEFWRRWHISLSNWFRDYVYIPMGGNRKGKNRTYLNLLIIFLLCGLWHGANWTFVIWGLWHGMFLVFERSSLVEKIPGVLKNVYTLLVILVGWVFFRSDSLNSSIEYLNVMMGLKNFSSEVSLYYFPDSDVLLALFAGLIGSTPLLSIITDKLKERKIIQGIFLDLLKMTSLFLLFALSAMALASGTYNPFIYFRF